MEKINKTIEWRKYNSFDSQKISINDVTYSFDHIMKLINKILFLAKVEKKTFFSIENMNKDTYDFFINLTPSAAPSLVTKGIGMVNMVKNPFQYSFYSIKLESKDINNIKNHLLNQIDSDKNETYYFNNKLTNPAMQLIYFLFKCMIFSFVVLYVNVIQGINKNNNSEEKQDGVREYMIKIMEFFIIEERKNQNIYKKFDGILLYPGNINYHSIVYEDRIYYIFGLIVFLLIFITPILHTLSLLKKIGEKSIETSIYKKQDQLKKVLQSKSKATKRNQKPKEK